MPFKIVRIFISQRLIVSSLLVIYGKFLSFSKPLKQSIILPQHCSSILSNTHVSNDVVQHSYIIFNSCVKPLSFKKSKILMYQLLTDSPSLCANTSAISEVKYLAIMRILVVTPQKINNITDVNVRPFLSKQAKIKFG